ncbi:molecular chaperone DjlA [Pseudomonas alcaligenes]|uniref:Molecular chaperone DjlA n=1 Tax=Aquipseudomonas alcaligenes TaxID=43263 RepID=A0ABR7S614_AQUAC|nr:co-chaperone DjlA [Pseudomonas alcaligenes]MBC9252457.1 molecular chaperone DjlA [Pseudomonas alcaligenes]
MLWPSTLIGAAAGWALASIPGALLGALLGQLLDRQLRLQSWAQLRGLLVRAREMDDDELLFMLLGRLAKCDGRVLDSHIRMARSEMQRLGLDEAATRRAMDAFARGKLAEMALHGPLAALRRRPERGEVLLRTCWRMAWADGRVSPAEYQLIQEWGQALGWAQTALDGLADEYEPAKRSREPSPGDYQAALRLLGVQSDSEPAAIKRAYRRLLSRHHPDKLAGSGASAAQLRTATEKTRELQSAYELVRQRRGFR